MAAEVIVETTNWETILSFNAPLVVAAFSGLIILCIWLFNKWDAEKEKVKKKEEEIEKSHVAVLVEKIDSLIEQMRRSFEMHEENNKGLRSLEREVDRQSGEIREIKANCLTRAKFIDGTLGIVNNRSGDVTPTDRCERVD